MTDIQVQRGPPAPGGPRYGWDGGSYATYNIAVEEFSTYFAGPLGVWVHNEGVGRPPACQRVASLYLRFRRDEGRSPMGAFERLMELSSSPSRRAQIDPHLREVARQVTIDLYTEAGDDLSKIPSYSEMRELFIANQSPFKGRMDPAMIDVNHSVPKYLQEDLGIPNVNDVPGMPLHRLDHTRRESAEPTSFHSILDRLLPKNNAEARRRILGDDPDEAKHRAKTLLKQAYRDWIRVNELAPEGDDTFLNGISRVVDKWIDTSGGGG